MVHLNSFGCCFADEFCDSYPHHIHPTPGYWIECSRAISNRGSAWTDNHDCGIGLGGGGLDLELAEVDEGITNSPDGSIRFWHTRSIWLLRDTFEILILYRFDYTQT